MRRSAMVTLTLLPILAAAAIAEANPPEPAGEIAPPGMTPPAELTLSPPGMTPAIQELDEDPDRDLRMDCEPPASCRGGTVIRGGFGRYFHHRGGSSGG